MKNKFTKPIVALILAIACLSFLPSMPTYATMDMTDDGGGSSSSSSICTSDVPESVKNAAGCSTNKKIESVVGNVIKAIIGALGAVAAIFIVYGGVQYMTSSGDASKAKKARDTILYACIGLVIAALAFAITNFAIDVIGKA